MSISLRILLTLPISIVSGEFNFSVLKIIPKLLRRIASQLSFSNLVLLGIQYSMSKSLDVSELIGQFSLWELKVGLKNSSKLYSCELIFLMK